MEQSKMSTETKDKLHVHFDDNVVNDSTSNLKSRIDEANGEIHYTRDDLLELRNNLIALQPPKFIDVINDMNIDEKKRNRLRRIMKTNMNNNNTNDINYNKNSINSNAFKRSSNADQKLYGIENAQSGHTQKNLTVIHQPNEKDRINFQHLIAAALNTQKIPLTEQNHHQQQQHQPLQHQHHNVDNRRRRYGSGRFVENNFSYTQTNQWSDYFQTKKQQQDYRHSNYDSSKSFRDNFWLNRDDDHTKSDGAEDEPEWVSCGPTSKHDVIELHGFDGASQENVSLNDGRKKDSDGKTIQSSPSHTNASPPARSTPAKLKKQSDQPVKEEEYFNFEDFLKLDLPHTSHSSKDNELVGGNGKGNGESRFQRWFRRDSPPHMNTRAQNPCTSEHFFEMMQKKKLPAISNLVASSSKFRSVEELEAEIVPAVGIQSKRQQQHHHQQQQQQANNSINDLETFRKLLAQMSIQNTNNDHNRGNPINILDLFNRNSPELLQFQIAQQMVLKRPEAQILLQRLTNGEINQLHLLALLCNVNTNQYDRDTLIAVINVCNESQRIMQQNQLRAQQMRHGRSPTNQELRYHTQAIMQGAMLKKQLEDQCRKTQMGKMNVFGQNNRVSQKPKMSNPRDGFSFVPPNPMFGRHQNNHGNMPQHSVNNMSMATTNMHNSPPADAAKMMSASLPASSNNGESTKVVDFLKSQAITFTTEN